MTNAYSRKILVTGFGFVGSHLVEKLRQLGHDVTVLDKNLGAFKGTAYRAVNADLRYWEASREEYDYVFHLAGITNAKYAEANPLETYESNVLATANLLAQVRVSKRFIFTSSAVVYGDSKDRKPLNENSTLAPISLYGVSKVAAERLVRYYGMRRGIPYHIVRFFNLYGPGQDPMYIVPQLIEQAMAGQIRVRSREVVRDFVYIADAIDCLVKIAEHDSDSSAIWNVGSGKGVMIGHLSDEVSRLFSGAPIVEEAVQEEFSAKYLVADATRVKSLLGWNPTMPLSDGLMAMMRDYRKRQAVLGATANPQTQPS